MRHKSPPLVAAAQVPNVNGARRRQADASLFMFATSLCRSVFRLLSAVGALHLHSTRAVVRSSGLLHHAHLLHHRLPASSYSNASPSPQRSCLCPPFVRRILAERTIRRLSAIVCNATSNIHYAGAPFMPRRLWVGQQMSAAGTCADIRRTTA